MDQRVLDLANHRKSPTRSDIICNTVPKEEVLPSIVQTGGQEKALTVDNSPCSYAPPVGSPVTVVYLDLVKFNIADPLVVSPMKRERRGWLSFANADYITVTSDRPSGTPDSRFSDGLCIPRNCVLELRRD